MSVDVLIFAGQSNMQGQTECLPETNKIVENALEYRYLSDELVPLMHPVGEDIGDMLLLRAHEGHGSLVPDFCRAYIEKTGKQAVAIHTAKGNTRIDEWQKGTERFDAAIKKILGGINKAKEIGEIGNIYLIWLQGESDAIKKTSGKEYKERMIEFKNDLKKEIGIDKFAIIEVGYFCGVVNWLHDRTKEEGKLHDEVIMKAQEELPDEDGDFVLLTDICKKLSLTPSILNPFAEGHYSNKAMTMIGKEAGENLAKIKGEEI